MPQPKNKPMRRNFLFWISAGIIIIILWSLLQGPAAPKKDVTFSQFMTEVEQGKVEEVTITGQPAPRQVHGRPDLQDRPARRSTTT